MTELKKCPFCVRNVRITGDTSWNEAPRILHYCKSLLITVLIYRRTKKLLIKAWNRRAND